MLGVGCLQKSCLGDSTSEHWLIPSPTLRLFLPSLCGFPWALDGGRVIRWLTQSWAYLLCTLPGSQSGHSLPPLQKGASLTRYKQLKPTDSFLKIYFINSLRISYKMFWSYSLPTLAPNPFQIYTSLFTEFFNHDKSRIQTWLKQSRTSLPILSTPSLITNRKGTREEAVHQTWWSYKAEKHS